MDYELLENAEYCESDNSSDLNSPRGVTGDMVILEILRASVSTNECDWLTQRPFFALKVIWIVFRNFRFWIDFGSIWIQNGNFKLENRSKKFSNVGSPLMSRDRELSEPSKKFEGKKKFGPGP